MALSNQKSSLFDPIRKKWVENSAEEAIRQRLIRQMVEKLGYPKSHIAVEKELSQLPHLRLTVLKEIPKRRADVIVFIKNSNEALAPLLMIECKALPLCSKFARQVIGYNAFVQAPFVALANAESLLTGFFDKEHSAYRFESGLPNYDTLLKHRCFSL